MCLRMKWITSTASPHSPFSLSPGTIAIHSTENSFSSGYHPCANSLCVSLFIVLFRSCCNKHLWMLNKLGSVRLYSSPTPSATTSLLALPDNNANHDDNHLPVIAAPHSHNGVENRKTDGSQFQVHANQIQSLISLR